MAQKTHYQVLGVAITATMPVIRAAYYALAQKHHPDTGADPDDQTFRNVTASYAVLKDNALKLRYDAELRVLGLDGKHCPRCDGTGCIQRNKNFKEVVTRPCNDCQGTGRL